jgi:hypothetical protein
MARKSRRITFGPMRYVVHLIPHTHWDREWYLPLGGLRARLAAAVDRLARQLDDDPRIAAFLLDGQTALLEDYFTLRPEARARVADLVHAGRIQTGPWYVLADEQIPAGESLLRNLELGRADAAALGRSAPVLYSPDGFGHPAVLPALGLEYGLAYGVAWRGLGPDRTGGRDLVWWKAPDGRRLLLYHLPPDGYEIGSALLVLDDRLPAAWERVAAEILPRAATRHVALPVGADHHAADPGLGGLPARLAAVAPGFEFRLSSFDRFFQAALAEAPELGTVQGELRSSYGYTWTLQGAHGTRAPLKRRVGMVELLLTRMAEPLAGAALGRRSGLGDTDRAVLRRAWREVVQCHFHDSLCGTAHDAVQRAMVVRLEDAAAGAAEIVRGAVDALAGHDPDRAQEGARLAPRLLLWNGAARPRGSVVVAEATFFRRDVLVGPPGGRSPAKAEGWSSFTLRQAGYAGEIAPQLLAVDPGLERRDAARHYPDQDEVDRVRFAFLLPDAVPGLSVRVLEPGPAGGSPAELFAAGDGRTAWNGRVAVTVEPAGTVMLRSSAGEQFPGLLALESERDAGDSYTFAPVRGDVIRRPGRAARPRLTAPGPLVAGLAWGQRLRCGDGEGRGPGSVTADVRLEIVGDSPVVRCRIRLTNQARNHRVRLRFPTGLRDRPVLAGAQFGSILRDAGVPVRPRAARIVETPVATAPAHRWVAAARGARGLAVFAPGFFEYEWTRRGDLIVTLLRAVGELSRGDLSTRPGHAGWPTAVPLAQCLGSETIELGLAPVTESDLATPHHLERLWEDCSVPLLPRWIRECTIDGPGPARGSVTLDGEGLVFSAMAPAADGQGIVLRCYNALGHAVAGAWRVDPPVARAVRIRADGTPLAPLPVEENGAVVRFRSEGHEIVTVAVTGR